MLFKILHGDASRISTDITPFHEGYCYVTHNGYLYVDINVGTAASPNNQRIKLNAKDAETIMGASLSTLLNSSDLEIPTSAAVLKALAGKASATHDHNDKYYTEAEVDAKLASKANTADIPDSLADLSSDTTHRTVTDAEKATWNAKSNFSGNYNDLTNKPTIPSISGLATQTYVDDLVSTKVDKVTGKGLSTNDLTGALKGNYDAAYTHSQSAHARTDATKVADSTTNGNILINDTETNVYTHPNSGVSAGTYKSVTVNAQGHVTAGSNPTTLSGYGITDAETKSDASAKLAEAKSYADSAATKVKNDLLNGAGAAYDTLKELGDLIDVNVDAIEALEQVASSKANASDLTAHINNKSNPHGVTLSQLGVTATASELNYVDGVTSNIQTQLNAKQPTVTGAATTITGSNLTASRALVSDANGKVAVSAVTSTELGYLDGVTSAIQTQINGKAAQTDVANAQARANEAYDLADLAANMIYIGPDMPTDPNIKIWINTAEEGTGVVPVLPRIATITLAANAWTGSAAPYSQVVNIPTVTSATKVELNATVAQIVSMQNDDIALMAENNNGVVTIYSFGGKPSANMTMQVTLTEVAYV